MANRVVAVDPSSVLRWDFNWTAFLAAGDSVSAHAWSIDPDDGTLAGATTAAVTVSGLSAGKRYRLTDHVVTATGEEHDQSIILVVGQL